MINLLILVLSFFPISENYNQTIDPYSNIYENAYQNKNNLKYSIDVNENIKTNNLSLNSYTQNFLGEYKYKYLYVSLNYTKESHNFTYKDEDKGISIKNNIDSNLLNLNLGFYYNKFLVKSIFNFNFDESLDNILTYGLYLDYKFKSKNLKYKIYFSKYKDQEKNQSNFKNSSDLYLFHNKYSKTHNDLGLDLKINNFIKIEIKKKLIDIKSLIDSKVGYTFEESGQVNKYSLKTQVDLKEYSFYLAYKEIQIDGELKGELDNVKFSKFVIKDFYNKSYNFGFIFKNLTNLDIGFLYQSLNTYYFGNVEAWPFPEYDENWIGGKANLSAKSNYDRYVLRIQNRFSLFKNKIELQPSLYYDKLIINPSMNTYEAGILGLGKRNEKLYNENIIADLIKISLLLKSKVNKFELKLYLSQIIPINIENKGQKFSQTIESKNTSFLDKIHGFSIKFSILYSF